METIESKIAILEKGSLSRKLPQPTHKSETDRKSLIWERGDRKIEIIIDDSKSSLKTLLRIVTREQVEITYDLGWPDYSSVLGQVSQYLSGYPINFPHYSSTSIGLKRH